MNESERNQIEQLQKRIAQLSALYSISAEIVLTEDPERVLEFVLEKAVGLLNSEVGVILLSDKQKSSLRIKHSCGINLKVLGNTEIQFGQGLAGRVAQSGRMIKVNNFQDQPDLIDVFVECYPIQSAVCLPIKIKDQTVGVIYVSRFTNLEFLQDEIGLLNILCNRAGVALESAELYSRLRATAESESERAAELEKVNEELRRTEEKYRVQFEGSLDAIFLADVETGLLIDCNSAATRLVERDKSELIGRHQRILHPPEKIEGEFSVTFKKHIEENHYQALETKIITKNGQIKDVAITPTLLEIDGNKVLQGIFRDITERKRSEEFFIKRTQQAIRYQNVQLKLAKMMKDDVFSTLKTIVEEDARTLEVERVGVWFFNANRTEIICEDLYAQNENVHLKGLSLKAEDYPRYFKALEESRTISANDAQTDTRTCEFTEKYLEPLGITSMMDVPIWLHGRVVGAICHEHIGPKREWSAEEQDFASSIADMVSITIEASERRKTEEALKRSEERFKHVAENSGDWIWEVDVEGLYTYSSPVVEKLLGYEPGEVVEKKYFYDFFDPDVKEELKKAAFEAFTRKESFRDFVNPNIHKNGNVVILETSGTPVLDDAGNLCGYRGADRDITARKEAELRQGHLLKQLEKVNKELRSFGYIVSHDLKAPLRGVKVLVDWICKDYADKLDEEGRHNMDLLVTRVDRMHNLIDGILQYSKIGRVKEEISYVNLEELVPVVIDMISPPENIEITLENKLPIIECERTRITQVFQNLLSNAVKYMDKPQGLIKISCVEEDDFWKFSVADNGQGIEEEYFDRIFQMFQTLSPRDKFESTGVGLTVVQKIIELYGGRIWVESRIGQGSTFIFTIPKLKELKERVKYEKLQTSFIS